MADSDEPGGTTPKIAHSTSTAPAANASPGDDAIDIVNRSGLRLAIPLRDSEGHLVLSPFSQLRLTKARHAALRLSPFRELGYVVERSPEESKDPPFDPSAVAGLLLLVLVVSAITYIHGTVTTYAILITVLVVAGLSLIPDIERWQQQRMVGHGPWLRDQLWRALGILSVIAVGYGMPLVVLWVQCKLSLRELLDLPFQSVVRLFLLSSFLGIAATLPAMLFFLFAERRQSSLKDQFFRDILRLDPSLRTIDEAADRYAPLMRDVLETRRGLLFVAPILISTFLLALGWVTTAMPTATELLSDLNYAPNFANFLGSARTEFTFAFMGTYFFSINMVFRRYVRSDLGPKAYSHIAVRIIVASILSWVAAQALPHEHENDIGWVTLMLAFFIGIVPETGVALVHDLLKSAPVGAVLPSLRNLDPLTELEGITLYDKARLLEEGIENIENLAHHNLVALVIYTRIPTSRLVDLMDQAILYLHVRDLPSNDGNFLAEPRRRGSLTLAQLKSMGVRTATEFELVTRDQALCAGLVRETNLTNTALQCILRALEDDEWMPQLRSWRHYHSVASRLYDLDALLAFDDRPSYDPDSLD